MEKLKAENIKSSLEEPDEEVDVGVGNKELEAEVADNKDDNEDEEYNYESDRSLFPEDEWEEIICCESFLPAID